MSTRNHHLFFKLTFTFLLVANLVLGYLLMRSASYVEETKGHNQQSKQALQFAYQSFFACQPETIAQLLFELDLAEVLARSDRSLFLMLPASPCDACLNYQLSLLKEEFLKGNAQLSMIVPSSHKRQILAKLGKYVSQVNIFEYDENLQITSVDTSWLEGQLLFFYLSPYSIEKAYVVNKAYGEATRLYLQQLTL